MKQDTHTHDDEIDLIELFKILWERKLLIIIITTITTLAAVVYVNVATPIYEVKSVIEIGYTNPRNSNLSVPIDSDITIEQKIKSKFTSGTNNLENGIVSKANALKNGRVSLGILEVSTRARTNNAALEKNKQVLEYLQQEYQYKIDDFILETNYEIKDLESKLNYVNKVEIVQLEYDIQKIKANDIPRVEREISYISNTQLPDIENKILQTQKTINHYEKEINKFTDIKTSDNDKITIVAIQALNLQNLAINAQNKLDQLEQQKQQLANFRLLDLEKRIENLKNELRAKSIELEINTTDKSEKLQTRLEIEKSRAEEGFKNTNLLSNYIINSKPIKPKKHLLVFVGFAIGILLSFLIILVLNFINKKNE